MNYKGVIFDFNGTLFWDTQYHNQAWNEFLMIHNIQLTDDQSIRKVLGRTNQDILRGIIHRELSEKEISSLSMEKELLYQKICLKSKMELASGATDLFRLLMAKKIPFTIATASGRENIDFYFEHLALGKWFNYDKVVYNDGSFRGKPHPDIFLLAVEKLKMAPKDIIVFEDSYAGIQAAEYAGVGKIFIVNSNNADYHAWSYDIITNFNQVDRKLFADI